MRLDMKCGFGLPWDWIYEQYMEGNMNNKDKCNHSSQRFLRDEGEKSLYLCRLCSAVRFYTPAKIKVISLPAESYWVSSLEFQFRELVCKALQKNTEKIDREIMNLLLETSNDKQKTQ